ncbi:MAG: XRE family transcriptional regulator [Desulfarculus sp.]|nr:XRE family transcriptional regulator [Desulfarculus sp.]
MNLGALLRGHRKAKRLTLKAVAEKAGVSEGFLSQVENSVKTPSLDTLMNICAALEIDAGGLLHQFSNQERLFTVRKAEWGEVDLPHTGFATRRFCPPDYRAVIDSAMVFLEPGKSIPVRKNIKNGQEVLCVLQGRMELELGDQKVLLEAGDAIHFFCDPPRQRITNPGPGLAVTLWVGTM